MKYKNLAEMFFSKREECPEQVAYRYKSDGEWRSLTFGAAIEITEKISAGFNALDIQRGDRIALISDNRWEWVLTDYATMALGACLVPIYPSLSPAQTRYILNDSAAKLLIVENRLQLDKIEKIKSEISSVNNFFIIECEKFWPDSPWQGYAELIRSDEPISQNNSDLIQEEIKKTAIDDEATIIYTSGTTGEPKGVVLTHKNFLSNVEAVSQFFVCGPEDTDLSFLPLSHVLERTAGHFFTCYNSATVAFAQAIDTIADDILDIKPFNKLLPGRAGNLPRGTKVYNKL